MPKPARQGIMAQVLGRMAASETLISDRYADSMLIGLLGEAEKVEDAGAAETVARGELAAAWGVEDGEVENRKPFVYRDGIAVIPVHGILINRFSYSWGFVTGYDFIRKQMNLATADSDVKLIVFDHDTPGGEAAGCDELAREIHECSKPTMALVNTLSASGGYWLAAPCNRIVCAPSGTVGSIGVYILHMNIGKMLADWGIEVEYVQRGEYKTSGSPYSALSKKDRQYLQSMVDERYDEFVAAVAEFRGIEETVARDTEARVMRPTEAIALGLIDAAVSPAKAVADFIAELGGDTDDEDSQEDLMADQSNTEITSEQRAAIASEERQRVKGITTNEAAKGRESLAEHLAHNTDQSVDSAVAILNASPKAEDPKPAEGDDGKDGEAEDKGEDGKDGEADDKGAAGAADDKGDSAAGKSQFERAMDDGKHPEVGATGGGTEAQSSVDRILGAQALATGRKVGAKAAA